jgi:hypothetical protein
MQEILQSLHGAAGWLSNLPWGTILSLAAASGLVSAAVSVSYQSRFTHRAELLAAYSELFANFKRMRQHLGDLAEDWVQGNVMPRAGSRGPDDEGDRARAEAYILCLASIWRVQLVEDEQQLADEVVRLFNSLFSDELPKDIVQFRLRTNELTQQIDQLVRWVSVAHKFPSAKRFQHQHEAPEGTYPRPSGLRG